MNTKERSVALLNHINDFEYVIRSEYKNHVFIGDVFDRIMVKWGDNTQMGAIECQKVLYHYPHSKFTQSLNEIFDSEMEYEIDVLNKIETNLVSGKRFKNENVQNLLDFLWEIFGEQILSNQKKS